MFTAETKDEIEKAAQEFGIEPAALLAIAEIESGGSVFAMIDGKEEPLIRFEGHYFDARLTGDVREMARSTGLASPNAGEIRSRRLRAGGYSHAPLRSTARRHTNPCHGESDRLWVRTGPGWILQMSTRWSQRRATVLPGRRG